MVAVMKKGDTRSGTGCEQLAVLPLNHFESADAAAYIHPDFTGIFRRHVQAGLLHGELRSRQSKLDKPAHLLDFFTLDEFFGVEILDFPGNPATEPKASKSVIAPMPDSPCREPSR